MTDRIGGMAKSVKDLTYLVDAIMDKRHYAKDLTKNWVGQKISFIDDTSWGFVDFICTADPVLIQQQRAHYRSTKTKPSELGATVREDVPL